MATKAGIKNFYRQKKNAGISKPNNKSSKPSTSMKSATFGSDQPQPKALISHGSFDLNDGYDGKEEILRQFDMNMSYGPCIGMTRLARWERAKKLGMNPPKDVENLLKGGGAGGKVRVECLWDGLV